ncbi:MAG: uracil-DNA glycosylase family protein [Anaerolineae bacterium]|nr:uracil-DNA glycosylase family protein [Anaerolineae bacterium]
MRSSDCVQCQEFPCVDVNTSAYAIPDIDIIPENVRLVLISEAAPQDPADYYYAAGAPQAGSLFEETTVLAFRDAGADVASLQDILEAGVYLTTAVKCAKMGYTLKAATTKTCSFLLEAELAPFTNVKGYLLMGDVAIRAINYIAKRNAERRVVPAGSTYKIRGGDYRFRGIPAFPSYLQAGPSFFIEKSKRRMIAEDIAAALHHLT